MTTPTAEPSWSPKPDEPDEPDVEDLSSIWDHVDAMLAATSSMRRVMVLGSAEKHGLGGVRVVCSRHPHSGEMSFRELRRHVAKVEHSAGDVTPTGPDARDAARTGDREVDQ